LVVAAVCDRRKLNFISFSVSFSAASFSAAVIDRRYISEKTKTPLPGLAVGFDKFW
jgi:hypothetical protein